MATQRLFIATIAGEAASATANRFRSWSDSRDAVAIDRFCQSLRDHAAALPIIYFSEWIDRWLMGDQVPGPNAVEGQRFQATFFSRAEATEWADCCISQHQEHDWLKSRLCEAASAWRSLADRVVIVVVREVLGGSATDEEVRASLEKVPHWLLPETPAQ